MKKEIKTNIRKGMTTYIFILLFLTIRAKRTLDRCLKSRRAKAKALKESFIKSASSMIFHFGQESLMIETV